MGASRNIPSDFPTRTVNVMALSGLITTYFLHFYTPIKLNPPTHTTSYLKEHTSKEPTQAITKQPLVYNDF